MPAGKPAPDAPLGPAAATGAGTEGSGGADSTGESDACEGALLCFGDADAAGAVFLGDGAAGGV
jgi:hypothetical protein